MTCSVCGAAVEDKKKHDDWHVKQSNAFLALAKIVPMIVGFIEGNA